MKALKKILSLIFISSLFLACGDNGDNYTAVPKQVTETHVFRIPIRGFAGQFVTEKELKPIALADIIGEDAARNLVRAEMQVADCYLEIRGLKNMENNPVLKDFTLEVGKTKINFGNCTTKPSLAIDFESDRRQSTTKFSSFIKAVFDTYTGKARRANLIMQFTPTEDIFVQDNVELVITITGTYSYNIYTK